MFNFFKEKNKNTIFSPVEGKCISITSVPDEMFAEKIMGDGIAFIFDGDTIHSPCNGKIVSIARTKHALGIKADNGIEILIHIGLDTVELNGKGFELWVSENSRVKAGQPLIKIDRNIMKENEINLVTPMVITKTDYELEISNPKDVGLEDVVINIRR